MSGPDSPVLREIADTRRRVVGIVINAIDDSLSGPVQIAPDWNLEYLAVLRPLLDEAAAAGRIVLLTADHGHILDYGTEYRRQEGSDRYHPGKGGAPGEYYLEGGRVVGTAGLQPSASRTSATVRGRGTGIMAASLPRNASFPSWFSRSPSVRFQVGRRSWSRSPNGGSLARPPIEAKEPKARRKT